MVHVATAIARLRRSTTSGPTPASSCLAGTLSSPPASSAATSSGRTRPGWLGWRWSGRAPGRGGLGGGGGQRRPGPVPRVELRPGRGRGPWAAGGRAADVVREARRLCRPGGSVVIGFRRGAPAAPGRCRPWLRRGLAAVLVALPSPGGRRSCCGPGPPGGPLLRPPVAFAYRPPGRPAGRPGCGRPDQGGHAAPPAMAVRAAPGRLAARGFLGRAGLLLEGVSELVRAAGATSGCRHRPGATCWSSGTAARPPGWRPCCCSARATAAPASSPVPPLRRHQSAPRREAATLGRRARLCRRPGPERGPAAVLGLHRVAGTEVLLQTGARAASSPPRRRPPPPTPGRPEPSARPRARLVPGPAAASAAARLPTR